MMVQNSLHRKLLLNIVGTFIAAILFSVAANYWIIRHDLNLQEDMMLRQLGHSFQAILQDPATSWEALQKELDGVLLDQGPNGIYDQPADAELGYQFQVWNMTSIPQLLLRSTHGPKNDMSGRAQGIANTYADGIRWRTYTIIDAQHHLKLSIAQSFSSRTVLANKVVRHNIVITLCFFPFLILVVWSVLCHGLGTIERIARQISNRDEDNLDPFEMTREVPKEIRPIIEELNKLFLLLQQAFEREKRFAADAAHELRTPLAGIRAQAQVAISADDPVEQQTMLRNVITGVDRATHVVQQLLTLSRLLPNPQHLQDIVHVALPPIASEVIAMLAPTAIAKGIELELIVPPTKDPEHYFVNGNATALSVLIRNLVDNAIRYTPSGGDVKVLIDRPTEDDLLLRVSDTGPGIPPELRSRVFERFYRILGTQSTGSGLGLAIVQQIADLHRAEVRLAAGENGTGLQVEIWFRLRQQLPLKNPNQ